MASIYTNSLVRVSQEVKLALEVMDRRLRTLELAR
jgi:hypothetical protein